MTPSQPPIPAALPPEEKRRRRRELVIIVAIIAFVSAMTYVENRIINFGTDFPISNTVLMFILININLLLLILLIFLVLRNLVKLIYDRRRRVMGAKLRTKLVASFVALSLLPTIVLFFFSINFITNSIEFWFNVPVEQALENSLQVGRKIYQQAEDNNRFLLERIAYQVVKKKLLEPQKTKALSKYIQVVQREFNLDAVEVYSANAARLSMAIAKAFEDQPFQPVAAAHLLRPFGDTAIRTVSKNEPRGEFIRTMGTVPFGSPTEEAAAFIVLSQFIPPDLAESMAGISNGVSEYQQMKLLKQPIKISYYITLSIVALLVVFCAVWFGFYLAKSITIPIKELAEGTRRVAEGDLAFSLGAAGDDEIGTLVYSFNKMTRDLRSGHEQLELSADKLREQNVEIEERRRYMETVLKNVSAGVITIDADGLVRTFNPAAQQMLSIDAADVLHRSFKNLLKGLNLNIARDIVDALSTTRNEAAHIPLRLAIDGRPRSFLAYVNALTDEGGNRMGIVMVIDDLTELEKAQRMAAWREVARRIAHEVKNPLTPISLSAQRLKRRYSAQVGDTVFEECTQMIINHVELIRNLVNEFSTFARFPTADLKPDALAPIIEDTVALYREGHPDIHFEMDMEAELPELNLDRQQIKQALINLLDNAVAAIRNQGQITITVIHDAILKLVRLEVADDGCGITDEDKSRLFEPNFSTKKSGMGLGLTIVNSIITDHNGVIRAQDNQPEGAKFVIELPTA
ncbi:MAG: ATP-binding protein [Desulfosarcinaceae bacterium]|nr:ATP-binding protein [Desulfosarcinaceae bacterium]